VQGSVDEEGVGKFMADDGIQALLTFGLPSAARTGFSFMLLNARRSTAGAATSTFTNPATQAKSR